MKPSTAGGGVSGGGGGAAGGEASMSLRQASISKPDISQMKPFKPSTISGEWEPCSYIVSVSLALRPLGFLRVLCGRKMSQVF